jgi:predicted 3-demethylubiquinone-9 3-methyltransferase (glyoxalase superfamily)
LYQTTINATPSNVRINNMHTSSAVSICLWYDGNAEAAARLYTSLIPNSEITSISPMMVTFTLDGVAFQGLNGGPLFKPTEAASIVVSTKDQADTDRLWNALIADGGTASQCAWLKDRFGVSWQIVPQALPTLLGSADRQAADRVLQAMLKMTKIEIADLEAAFNDA